MVVGDDDVQPNPVGVVDRAHGPNATIDGDDHVVAICRQFVQRLFVEAVSLVHTVGDIGLHPGCAHGAQRLGEEHGTRHAICIIIAIDGDPFSGLNGALDSLDGRFHSTHEEGVARLRRARFQKCPHCIRFSDPPIKENLGDQWVNPL